MTVPAIEVDHVYKKFSRNGAAGMRYSLHDIWRDFFSFPRRDLKLRRHEFWSLKDVSLDVEPGECVALLGPNGAGKSTMLKLLNGIYLPESGKVTMRGRVGAMIELGAGFHPLLTGRENIYINGAVLGLSREEIDERFDSIVEFSGIGEFINTAVRFYSSGMYVRLGFAIATQVRPDIILIDEILAVGDAGFRMKCFKHLMDMSERGTAMVIVSHSPTTLARVCDRAIVFDHGQSCFDGSLLEGMGIYHNLLNVSRNGDDNTQESGAKKGGGRTGEAVAPETVYLDSIEVMDEGGNPCETFQTGDDIHINIRISANETIEKARLIVAVVSPSHGNLSSMSSPWQDFWFDIRPPSTSVRLTLRNIPLLAGGYSFNISLFGHEVETFYDRNRNIAPFRIVGPPIDTNGYGLCEVLKLDHSWDLLS